MAKATGDGAANQRARRAPATRNTFAGAAPAEIPADHARRLEARYRALVLATGVITWTAPGESDGTGAGGDGRDWSAFTGHAPDHGGWLDALHPDDRDRIRAAWKATVAARASYEIEYRVRRHDGVYRWLLVRGVPVLTADGASVDEWVGTATDISERKHAEKRMRTLQEVTAHFARTQTLTEVREVMLGDLVRALDARGAGLRLIQGGALVLEGVRHNAPMNEEVMRRMSVVPLDADHPAAAAARRGEPVFIADAQECARQYPALAETVRQNATQAVAHLPLWRGDAIFGVLSLDFVTPCAWDSAARDVALALADQTAVAYERARLFEAERAADADAQRQARLVELSFEPVVVWSEQDGIIEWNTGAEQLYGYTRAEAIGKTCHDLLRTVFSDSLAAMLAALERDGRWAGELRHTTKDGREVVVESRHQAITVDGRRVILETNRDVTERQRSKERLRASEERFRTLAENISQLAWMAHPDGYIYWYNPRWYAYTGTTPESQVGWGWQSVHDPNELPRVMERWTTSIASGQAFDMVFPLRGADGVFRPFLTRIMPVKDEHGQVTGWFGTNTDISDQVRLQEELRTANAAKDEFLSIASHELRTPITSSKANLQLIARRIARVLEALGDSTEPDAAAAHAQLEPLMPLLARGEVSLNRLNRLVGDLLDSSRIQAGKLAIRPACVDLRALVREAMDEALQPWPLRVVRAAGALQAERTERQATPIWVNADPDRLRQVVINLLTNAFKYAPADRPITVGLEARGAMARVWVRDQGPGLSPEQQAHLFERFYRVEGIGHQEGSNIGLGLGLYICREIVTLHGGQMGIESAPGKGSTFWFTVPLSDSH